jgi:cell division control protein 7
MNEVSMVCADDFEIGDPIGSGSFSNVLHARHKQTGREVALKRLFWNNSPERVMKEARWLIGLNHPNIARLLAMFRQDDQATLVLEYVPHQPYRKLLAELNGDLIKHYMFGLLTAIEYIHNKKIIHRDIKPSNFLFDPVTCKGCLIDFGLCEQDLHLEARQPIPEVGSEEPFDLQFPEKCQNRPRMIASRAGTRGFRAPEVLFCAWNQSTLIDIWSAGVVLLSLLSQRYPFFKSPDDLTSLVEVSSIVGTERLREAARECGRRVKFPVENDGMDLKDLCSRVNHYIDELGVDDSVFDLLAKMMEPVPSKRISARDALQHPFFADMKDSNA